LSRGISRGNLQRGILKRAFDMAVKKDAAGSMTIRWLPEMLCSDQSMASGNPEGAVFNNCRVGNHIYVLSRSNL